MLTRQLKLLLLSLVACFMCSACGAAPASSTDEQSVTAQSEALTAVSVDMWAPYELAPPVAGATLFRINDDAANPTPNFIQLQVTQTINLPDVYFFSTKQARGKISATDWNTMSTILHNGTVTGVRMKVRVTYDSSVTVDQKPWTPPSIQFFQCTGIGLVFGPNCG